MTVIKATSLRSQKVGESKPIRTNATLIERQAKKTPDLTTLVYAIPGTGAKIEMITHPNLPLWVAKGVIPGSKQNGERIAAEIEKAIPGSSLRDPTEDELLGLNELLGSQLDGNRYWIWTSTRHDLHPAHFVQRLLGYYLRIHNHPRADDPRLATRFVKNK